MTHYLDYKIIYFLASIGKVTPLSTWLLFILFIEIKYFAFLRTFIRGPMELTYRLTAWKVSRYGVFSGPYFPVFRLKRRFTELISVFSPNAGKYGPDETPYFGHLSRSAGGQQKIICSKGALLRICYISMMECVA